MGPVIGCKGSCSDPTIHGQTDIGRERLEVVKNTCIRWLKLELSSYKFSVFRLRQNWWKNIATWNIIKECFLLPPPPQNLITFSSNSPPPPRPDRLDRVCQTRDAYQPPEQALLLLLFLSLCTVCLLWLGSNWRGRKRDCSKTVRLGWRTVVC